MIEYWDISILKSLKYYFETKNFGSHKKITSSARDMLVKTLMLKNEIPNPHPF